MAPPLEGHLLLLQGALHGHHLIAIAPRLLELQALGGLVHPGLQPVDQLIALALQEEEHVVHAPLVGLPIDLEDAGRWAAPDLVLQARPVAVIEHRVPAGAQLKVTVDHPQGLPGRRSRVEGTKVARAVLAHMPHHLHPGVLMLGIDAQTEVLLVVLPDDVEARLVTANQLALQKQRLFFGARDHGLQIGQQLPEQMHKGAVVARALLKVGGHPRAQALGLANVDDLSARALHQIDAGLLRQRVRPLKPRCASVRHEKKPTRFDLEV